jgi:porphobilinogen synthase
VKNKREILQTYKQSFFKLILMLKMSFSQNIRLRRNRKSAVIRNLVSENSLLVNDLILPLFVIEGKNKKEEIKSLEGIFRYSIDLLVKKAQEAFDLGISAIMIFPVIEQNLKSFDGKEALNENNLICRCIKEVKKKVPEISIISDIALDPFSSHGHDGIINESGYVLNDETVEILCKQAINQVKAGCDIVAPSDMMDHRIAKIREALDKEGFVNASIMSYSAKYASNYYGPFRDGVGSSGNLNSDKKNYQMDFRNSKEAIREIEMDINEGADFIIVKPGIIYLDIVNEAAKRFNSPIISYQVSGEYQMLKLAAKNNLLNFNKALYENLIAFKRAGASAVITYGAIEMAKIISNQN